MFRKKGYNDCPKAESSPFGEWHLIAHEIRPKVEPKVYKLSKHLHHQVILIFA